MGQEPRLDGLLPVQEAVMIHWRAPYEPPPVKPGMLPIILAAIFFGAVTGAVFCAIYILAVML